MKQDGNVAASTIRNTLKRIVADEINHLPERLEGLTPQERVRVLLSVLPYVAPRITSVDMHTGEGLASCWDD